MTELRQTTETILLLGAQDASERIFMTDERTLLPWDAVNIQEFSIEPEKLEWAILRVQVEAMRGMAVTILMGEYRYVTEERTALPQGREEDWSEKGEA